MKIRILIFAVATVGLSGCVSFPKDGDYVACNLEPRPLQPSQVSMIPPARFDQRRWDFALRNDMEACNEGGNSFSVLSLSGGGPDGAFGAGFLVTRLKSQHEKFHPCLVTGVSTGAVMAAYVYLATSTDPDRRKFGLDKLSDFYQKLDESDLAIKRSYLSLIFSDSLYQIDGIHALLDREVDGNLLRQILEEYEHSHRRMAIGATDLGTGSFDIIDLTEFVHENKHRLEEKNTAECVQEAVRASAAIPMVFPPVPMRVRGDDGAVISKLYVDGGVRRMMFINIDALKTLAGSRELKVYGVVNNTFDMSGLKNKVTLLEGARQNLKIVTDQLYMDSAYAVQSAVESANNGTKSQKAKVFWAAMQRTEMDTENKDGKHCTQHLGDKLFASAYQDCLYKVGVAAATSNDGVGWSDTPWPVLVK